MENTPRCRCRNASRTVTNPRLSPRESVSLKSLCGDCPHGVRTGKLRSKEKSASIHCFSQFLSSTFFRLSHRDLAACGEIDGTRAITVPCDKSQEEAQIGRGSMEEAHHLNHRSHACIHFFTEVLGARMCQVCLGAGDMALNKGQSALLGFVVSQWRKAATDR